MKLAAAGLFSRAARAEERGPVHVVVVGAGPAGLSAALELAERGVLVTLCEAAGAVGGKVMGWTEQLDGVEVDVEHGVHGLAEGYVHFTDLMARYALEDGVFWARRRDAAIRSPDGEMGIAGGGRMKLFHELRKRAKAAGYPCFIRPYLKGRRWIGGLDRAEARQSLGGQSVADWHESGAPLTRFRLLPRVMSLSLYFVEPDQLDAGTFAISERWNGVKVRWMRGNPQTLFWEPLAAALRAQRGKVRLNTRVRSLIVEDGCVVGVRLGEAERRFSSAVPEAGWVAVDEAGTAFLGRLTDGSLAALDSRCTHAGCPVAIAKDGFACPCHGGRYNTDGVPIGGPPPRPLVAGRVELDDEGEATVVLGGTIEDLRADAVILAVEPEAFGALAGDLLPRTRHLRNCAHAVARFWFDRDVNDDARETVLLSGYTHACNGFLLHRMQDRAAAWAADHSGAVIEIQAFKDVPQEAEREDLLDAIEADVRAIWPELARAAVLKRTLARGREFTWFEPGWHKNGVEVQTGIPGLLAAGDHLLVDRDCEFMERAVMTGRMAANLVLTDHGLPRAKILPPIGREKRGNRDA